MKDTHEHFGRRMRELRLERGLMQGEVARRLGVSAAYLSLIEKGKRAVQLPLLLAALEIYGVGMEEFMVSLGEPRVDEGLARLLDEPLLKTLSLSREDLASLGAEPKVATTITALFNLYKNTRGQLDHLLADLARRERDDGARQGGELGFDYSPFDEVTDFLESRGNYFPLLEERADAFREAIGLAALSTSEDLVRALRDHLGVEVELVGAEGASSVIRRFDAARGVLTLSADMAEHRRKFQLAHTIGLRLIDEEHLDREIPFVAPLRDGPSTPARADPDAGSAQVSPGRHAAALPSERSARHSETGRLLKIHLANYLAGALLLPYGAFFEQVTRTRYDVDRLSAIFASSYETVAHRITNLSDPARRGVPFHFLRVDVAGNISKRYSATGLRFPHGTGSCPKWAVHAAFLTPHAIHKQYSEFPDGSRHFCFARVQAEPQQGSLARGTVYAIGLGTHADLAHHLAYADEMPFVDPKKMCVPVGTTCRFCERTDCNQRAAPSYKFAFRVDEYIKKDNFFSPLVSEDAELPARAFARAAELRGRRSE